MMMGPAETWVTVNGLVLDAAHLPRCQVAGATSVLGVPKARRCVGGSILHLDSSEHPANAFAVSHDAVEASGNANGDLERLQGNIEHIQRTVRAVGLRKPT